MRRAPVLVLAVLVAACKSTAPARLPAPPTAPSPATSPGDAPPTPKVELGDALHWFRNSAERRAIALQTYRWATERIEKVAQGHEAGSWGVILDADETVLDNSTYEKDLLGRRLTHTPELWTAWVARKAAPAIPGAAGFIGHVRALGGRVAIVSNRTEAECPDTAANLASLGVSYEALLCRSESRDKAARFAKVASGEAFADGKAIEVLMWVGDNIQDFPGMTQAIRKGPEDALAPFGSRFIVLPNPMYGSWESNPQE